MWFAWLLIILGTILLLQNMDFLPPIRWSMYWPLLLILFGIYLLKKKNGNGNWSWRWNKKDKEEKK